MEAAIKQKKLEEEQAAALKAAEELRARDQRNLARLYTKTQICFNFAFYQSIPPLWR